MTFALALLKRRWLTSFWGKALACTLLTAGLAQAQTPFGGLFSTPPAQPLPAPQSSPPPAFVAADGSTASAPGHRSQGHRRPLGRTALADPVAGGTHHCSWCDYNSPWGRCVGGVCDSLCCANDPWVEEANAAFFQDNPCPVTQTRLRPGHRPQ